MRNFFAITIFLLVLTGFNSTGVTRPALLIVTDEWAPYVYLENGELKGFDYEVMTAVILKMGYEIDFRVIPWKRCIFMIEEGEADAILDVSRTEKREKTMLFPDQEISESASVLFHQRGKQYSFEKLEDLHGLTVGTILGYAYSNEFLQADFFTREPVKNLEQNFNKLLYGRIDMVLSNKHVGLHTSRKMGIAEKIDYIPKTVSGGNNYLAFSKKPGHEQLVKEFSSQLKLFQSSRQYTEIMKKYGM